MKYILLCLLLSGCAAKCDDCITLTPAELGAELGAAMGKAWVKGYEKGFDAGEDFSDKKRLKKL